MVQTLINLLQPLFDKTPLARPGWKTVTGLTVLAVNHVLFLLLSSKGLYPDAVFLTVNAVAFGLTGVGVAHKQSNEAKRP